MIVSPLFGVPCIALHSLHSLHCIVPHCCIALFTRASLSHCSVPHCRIPCIAGMPEGVFLYHLHDYEMNNWEWIICMTMKWITDVLKTPSSTWCQSVRQIMRGPDGAPLGGARASAPSMHTRRLPAYCPSNLSTQMFLKHPLHSYQSFRQIQQLPKCKPESPAIAEIAVPQWWPPGQPGLVQQLHSMP